jgi:hypothetical protein
MVYEVRARTAEGETRLEFTRDEPLKVGETFHASGATSYTVLRIVPDESAQYDAVVEADWFDGPAVFRGA